MFQLQKLVKTYIKFHIYFFGLFNMHIIFINLEKSYMIEDVPKGIVQQLKTYMYAKSITAGVIERTIRPKKKKNFI